MKTVYRFNHEGLYVGPYPLDASDISPLEPGVYLIPGDCLEAAPTLEAGKRARAVNGSWVLEDIPPPPPPPAPPPAVGEPKPIVIDPASFLNLPAPKPEGPEDVQKRLVASVQTYMDSIAQGYGYDNINSAVSYAEEDSVPKFQKEGKAFRRWRSLVWARCYELLEEVEAGTRSVPQESDMFGLLPAFDPTEQEQQG